MHGYFKFKLSGKTRPLLYNNVDKTSQTSATITNFLLRINAAMLFQVLLTEIRFKTYAFNAQEA